MSQSARRSRSHEIPEDIRPLYPEFSRLLLARLNQLLPQVTMARAHRDEQALNSPGDEADVSVSGSSADYFHRLENTHQREIQMVRSALDRIRQGSYGICETCEEGIAIERLRRLPTARLCIDCQESRERATGNLHLTQKQ